MGKAPADQFYFGDFERDMSGHPLEVIGAWSLILCKTWFSDTRGTVSKSLDQWARIFGKSEDETLVILEYIKNERIGDISDNLTEPNKKITVTNRRQVRDEKDRRHNRLRQRKHYYNTKPNANLTPPSSSSSSPSKITTAKVSAFSLPDFLPKQTWDLFIDHRKKIKHPITEKAYSSFVEKFRKLNEKGWPPDWLVDLMIEKGWRWFRPEWVQEPPPEKKVVDLVGQERRAMQKDREQNKDEYLDPRQVAEITKKLGLDFGKTKGELA